MIQPSLYKIVQAADQRERHARAEEFRQARQCRVAQRQPHRASACP
jgi:hypothetical protein